MGGPPDAGAGRQTCIIRRMVDWGGLDEWNRPAAIIILFDKERNVFSFFKERGGSEECKCRLPITGSTLHLSIVKRKRRRPGYCLQHFPTSSQENVNRLVAVGFERKESIDGLPF